MPAKKSPVKTETTTNAAKHDLFLPDPEILANYEKIIPGGAERILEMSEQRSTHAQVMAEQTLKTATRTCRIKQAITFILALGSGVLGGALLLQGSELAGLLVFLIDAAALVGVTLYGDKQV